MHNGIVSDFCDIRRDITESIAYDAFCNIFGTTDSEHVAALYLTYLTNQGTSSSWDEEYPLETMTGAVQRTIVEIMKFQYTKLGNRAKPNSLNLCVTDGKKMVAIRFRNHTTQQPPSLYWSGFGE